MINPREFLDLIKEKDKSIFKIGTIDSSYSGGAAKIKFDGEPNLSVKGYLSVGYTPVAGDRVLIAKVKGTFVILGKIGGAGSSGVVPTDLTVYDLALAAVVEVNYTQTSWSDYQTVVNANVVTTANTQAEVDAATLAINTAQANLVTVVNAAESSATFTNSGSFGTLTVTVKDVFGDGIADLSVADFSIRTSDGTFYSMPALDAAGWTITFTDNQDGTYTIKLEISSTFTEDWDIIVDGVEVETNLGVSFG